ncbi:MAG: hypothetical protein NTZ33_12240 [Bacteroidetes bacterium]|nr:hypothetical protein [Bacteroidota bacterium]
MKSGKSFSLLIILFWGINLFSQRPLLYDTLSINSKTKLIGRYPHFDKDKTYEKWNFIIEDSSIIRTMVKTFVPEEEIKNLIENTDFRITIVENFKEIALWIINPKTKSVQTGGHTYRFNFDLFTKLCFKYPFKYKFIKKEFNSLNEYLIFLEEQKKNINFLFNYPPQFRYEGIFEIEFPKNEIYDSPKAISDILMPLIEQIVKKDEYAINYILDKRNLKNIIDKRNLKNNSKYIMTILGSKEIYKRLKVKNFKNRNWKKTSEIGTFFYRNN